MGIVKRFFGIVDQDVDDYVKDIKKHLDNGRDEINRGHIQYRRNLEAKELEREGKVDEAMKLYQKNIDEKFIGHFPYKRLADIYHKQKKFDLELEVLQKGIKIFETLPDTRSDKKSLLEEFNTRLNDVKTCN